jgi:hypothetical protein
MIEQIGVGLNLACKTLAIVCLLRRWRVAVHLLIVAFVVGLLGTLWSIYAEGYGAGFTTVMIASRAGGFVISLAIILYAAHLARQGFLKKLGSSHVTSEPEVQIFD